MNPRDVASKRQPDVIDRSPKSLAMEFWNWPAIVFRWFCPMNDLDDRTWTVLTLAFLASAR